MGYYLLKCYFSDHGIFGTITQPQKPSSSIVVYEQDNSQAVDSIDHSMLATVDNPPSDSGPVLVFRCPSDSEDDTEDDVELFEHPNTVARVQACSRIFKEMRDEDESLKASNVVLRMKQRRMERQAKTWDSKNARVNIKVSLVTGAFLEMKQINHQTRAELSAEEQARETEIRLRDATNGTELAKLQSLYKKASAELNSAYKKAGDLETEAGINKGLIQTLRSEVDRAELDKAERLDSERKLEDECSLKRIQELGNLRGKLTPEADAGISKKSEIVRLENERALKVRDEEIEKQRTLQEASNEELERLRQEVQTLKSAAVIEKQKLTEDLESTNKCLEEVSDEYSEAVVQVVSLQYQLMSLSSLAT